MNNRLGLRLNQGGHYLKIILTKVSVHPLVLWSDIVENRVAKTFI